MLSSSWPVGIWIGLYLCSNWWYSLRYSCFTLYWKFNWQKIKGETSGVSAKVEGYIDNRTSTKGNYTLYIKYQSSSDTDFSRNRFSDGENLIVQEDVTYSLSSIRSGSSFATTLISNATATGSAAKIAEGVYFIRGFFVSVSSATVILDQYTNSPSYRIGLLIKRGTCNCIKYRQWFVW